MISPPALAWTQSNQILHLILLPTEQCNFRCTYCYEDFALGRMTPGVVTGIKRLLEHRAPALDHLHISWFGGEPLLALDLMDEVMSHVQDLRRRHARLRLGSDATTNGSRLTPEAVGILLPLGVTRFQISLDGLAATHDRTRPTAGGRGTFASIWENLLHLGRGDADFEVLVRCHLTTANEGGLRDLLRAFAGAFGGDLRFSFLIRPIARLGGARDASLPVPDEASSGRAVSRLRREAQRLGLRMGSPDSGICYAARANSWVIRSDGSLAKCTVAFPDRRNRVGRILSDGTLEIQGEDVAPWIRGLRSGDPEELVCPLVGLPVVTNKNIRTRIPTGTEVLIEAAGVY